MSLIAWIIYIWAFLGGIVGVLYGYSHWNISKNKNDFRLMLFGLFALSAIIILFTTRFFFSPNAAYVSIFIWSRKIVALIILSVGLIVLWNQYIASKH
jgi:hypothetical protein